ncbi:MAG TPA: histidine phosphatase family protein [Spirochaetota bacterium]|nr:histidine phosphatase family protein [Spirochaetota bacterium]HPV42409.1 histidine phosphatase family protein [Spirochaetota bacterium]
MTTILAIRHGETEWNRIGKQQGHLNSDLTPLGIEQARRAAARLSRESCDIIYSSALGRAVQTAEIIARQTGLAMKSDSGLNERNLGILQGHTLKKFAASYPAEHARFISGDPDYIIPGGESVRQRYDRTIRTITAIAGANDGKRIALVTHGGNLDSLFRHVLEIPLARPRNFSLMNASLNVLSVEGGAWKVESWGDVSHLADIGALDDF